MLGVASGPGVPVASATGEPPGRAGIVSTCPSDSKFGSLILLVRTMSSTLTPNSAAIPDSVSPGLTEYVVGSAVGAASGVAVGVSTGVTSSLTLSSLVGAPASHPASGKISHSAQSTHAATRIGQSLYRGKRLGNSSPF